MPITYKRVWGPACPVVHPRVYLTVTLYITKYTEDVSLRYTEVFGRCTEVYGSVGTVFPVWHRQGTLEEPQLGKGPEQTGLC